jgi:hypothetical protein
VQHEQDAPLERRLDRLLAGAEQVAHDLAQLAICKK